MSLPGSRAVWTMDPSARERVSCWQVGPKYLVVSASRGNGNDGGDIRLAIQRTPTPVRTRPDATGYSGPEDDE